VWCHERCHKEESQPKRLSLLQAAVEVGGALVCFKKALKFEVRFLSDEPLPPFLLLTDWREVKLCLQAFERHSPRSWPVCTVVLAEETPQLSRATAWAEALPEGSPRVKVFADLAEARAFAVECLTSAHARRLALPGRGRLGAAAPAAGTRATAGGPTAEQQALVEPNGTEILSPLRRGWSPAELADLLQSAMPEYYDD